MKASILVLTVYIVSLMLCPVNAYCEDGASSGVLVFGPTEKRTTQSTPGGDASMVDQSGEGSGEGVKVKITGPELNSSFRVIYEIIGSKFGDTQVSEAVALPGDSMITTVDPGMGGAFTIVRVDAEGKESLALDVSPEHAIGKKLPKGTYKVYPLDPDGRFALEKLTAKVQVGLVGNDIMDPRGRGELYKTEKE
ncbi:MAG: hypothetical protein KKH57_00470 [Candidatus Omnitrophica bacterium]|nr:hypothetical protein [Candidatus Omnitrophota bacterium]